MNYVGNVIRLPSEANSIILQVTVGCSYNKCTLCGAYKDVPFQLKTSDIVSKDFKFARQYCRNQKKVFLSTIELALQGALPLVPDYMRSL